MIKLSSAILEIGCEEIPARFMPDMIVDLLKKATEKLISSRIKYEKIETFGTPRRLVLIIEGLAAKQEDLAEELKGPPAEIAYDKDGNPTQAVLGFAKKNNLDIKTLTLTTENGRKFVHASIVKKGQATEKILTTLFPEIINSLYMPISMRWGNQDFKFIRPIHWILALYGMKVVKFELAGIKSSNITFGHRYAKNPKTKILNPNKEYYFKTLLKLGVVVDQDKRKDMIVKAVKKTASSALIEEDLLNEVTFLVENPSAILCSFKPEFLALPKEVLITSMKKNQKYFPVLDSKAKITNQFVVICDNCKSKNIRNGNERVIKARLSDAKFFFDEDSKIQLRARVADLKRVQFFEGLGEMGQKTDRLKKLSDYIAKLLRVDEKGLAVIEKAANLSKADLLTQMVFEFPELQGVMGREYSLLSGEERAVADGIFEHYLPRHAGDVLPKSTAGTIVSLADKFDTLTGCFGLGKIPTGSADPYGLRRAVNGILKIIIVNKLELLLDEVLSRSVMLYGDILKDANFDKIYKQLIEFIAGRFKAILLDEGIAYDIIDASFANINDILFVSDIAKVLQELRSQDWFVKLIKTQDRVYRIAASATRDQIHEHDLEDQVEKDLFDLYLKVNWDVEEKINKGDYKGAVQELLRLADPVEKFFEKVLVMHQDERIKSNRLALLHSINSLFLKVCEFRKIVV